MLSTATLIWRTQSKPIRCWTYWKQSIPLRQTCHVSLGLQAAILLPPGQPALGAANTEEEAAKRQREIRSLWHCCGFWSQLGLRLCANRFFCWVFFFFPLQPGWQDFPSPKTENTLTGTSQMATLVPLVVAGVAGQMSPAEHKLCSRKVSPSDGWYKQFEPQPLQCK